ncbi:MAG TPA: hypothetical protein ENG27_01990 [Candidatus Bathyarchaeota archaeon]|nr:MAG: hypothetical protein DRO49_05960 [Candidatus Bathyarchaeota archaeon]HDM27070.1 hypothetical protein [Candidatus Bathyarchaeota archaeon]
MHMGYRWRWMYYLTGLPGWLRFGFSPGWLGVTPFGLPPTAQWLITSGMLPYYLAYLRTVAPTLPQTMPTPSTTPGATGTPMTPPMSMFPTIPKEEEKAMLEQHLKMLEAQIDAIRKRLEELERE